MFSLFETRVQNLIYVHFSCQLFLFLRNQKSLQITCSIPCVLTKSPVTVLRSKIFHIGCNKISKHEILSQHLSKSASKHMSCGGPLINAILCHIACYTNHIACVKKRIQIACTNNWFVFTNGHFGGLNIYIIFFFYFIFNF